MYTSYLICTKLFWLNCEWAQLDYKSEVAPNFLSTVSILAKLLKYTHQKVIQILCPAEFYEELGFWFHRSHHVSLQLLPPASTTPQDLPVNHKPQLKFQVWQVFMQRLTHVF